MQKVVTIYHNSRCSKSRQTLALIEEQGVTPRIVKYLETPPSAAELKRVLKKLGLKPRDILRKGEDRYAELGLQDPALKDDALIAAMVTNPILIERPIVVSGDKAALGRPPEAVLEIQPALTPDPAFGASPRQVMLVGIHLGVQEVRVRDDVDQRIEAVRQLAAGAMRRSFDAFTDPPELARLGLAAS